MSVQLQNLYTINNQYEHYIYFYFIIIIIILYMHAIKICMYFIGYIIINKFQNIFYT